MKTCSTPWPTCWPAAVRHLVLHWQCCMTCCTTALPVSVAQLRLQCVPIRADQGLHLLQEAIANSPITRKQRKRRHAQSEAASDADPAFEAKPQNGQLSATPAPENGGLQPQLAAAGQVQVHGVAHQITRAEMDVICRTEGGINRQSELLFEGSGGRWQGLQRCLRRRVCSISWGPCLLLFVCCMATISGPAMSTLPAWRITTALTLLCRPRLL